MALKANFSSADIKNLVERKREQIEQAIIRRLQYLGEKCVNEARQNGDYTDRTGNLRNSIGYVVVARGKILHRNDPPGGKDENSTGKITGKALAEKLAAQFKDGFVLIVVAGMEYALYVEAVRNKNVLNSAEKLAQRELPRLLAELSKKL